MASQQQRPGEGHALAGMVSGRLAGVCVVARCWRRVPSACPDVQMQRTGDAGKVSPQGKTKPRSKTPGKKSNNRHHHQGDNASPLEGLRRLFAAGGCAGAAVEAPLATGEQHGARGARLEGRLQVSLPHALTSPAAAATGGTGLRRSPREEARARQEKQKSVKKNTGRQRGLCRAFLALSRASRGPVRRRRAASCHWRNFLALSFALFQGPLRRRRRFPSETRSDLSCSYSRGAPSASQRHHLWPPPDDLLI